MRLNQDQKDDLLALAGTRLVIELWRGHRDAIRIARQRDADAARACARRVCCRARSCRPRHGPLRCQSLRRDRECR